MSVLMRLGRLLSLFAIVGLVISVAVPAGAMPAGIAAATMGMPDGAPPCHDTKPDCRDMSGSCAFQVACAGKCPHAALSAELTAFQQIGTAPEDAGDCSEARSLSIAPPARPPKT